MNPSDIGTKTSAESLAIAVATLAQTDLGANTVRRHRLLRQFWNGATGFWRAGGSRHSWALSSAILSTVFLNLATSYGMNLWNREIFDALERRDSNTVLLWSIIYLPLLAVSVSVVAAQVYARMSMQRRWRAWLNDSLLDRWLAGGRYYQLNLLKGDHANPEYRIADDIRVATEAPIDFVTGVTNAGLSAALFIGVLWTIGGSLTLTVFGATITVPGFLVIAAVLYALAASGAMLFIGRGFVAISEEKNQAEAEYRYVLTRLRENGESIAVLGGEGEERSAINQSMAKVLSRWREIGVQTMRTTIVSQTSGYVAWVLPRTPLGYSRSHRRVWLRPGAPSLRVATATQSA